MNQNELSNLLEEKLQQIQAGKQLNQVLEDQTSPASELNALLTTASRVRALNEPITVPTAAQNRSRANFLTAAGEARSPRPALFWLPRPRFSTAVLITVAVLVFAGLLSSGLASAQSIPGDTLYPVKIGIERARLSFAPDTASRLSLEESFDRERVEESGKVMQLGRGAPISFAGYLANKPGEGWEAAGLHLQLQTEQQAQAASMQGYYVDVQGRPAGETVQVDTLQVRLFAITGQIQGIRAGEWLVSGLPVRVTAQTDIRLEPKTSLTVFITATRQENGDWTAVVASTQPVEGLIYLPPTLTPSPTPDPTAPAASPSGTEDGATPSINGEDGYQLESPAGTEVAPQTAQPQEFTQPSSEDHSTEQAAPRETQKPEGGDTETRSTSTASSSSDH